MFFCQPMFSTTWHQKELALVFTGHIFLNVEDLTCWTSCQGLLCSFNRDQTYKNNMCPAVRSRWWPCSCVSFVYFCIAKEQNLTVDQNYHHFFKQQSIPRNQKDTLYIIYYIYIYYISTLKFPVSPHFCGTSIFVATQFLVVSPRLVAMSCCVPEAEPMYSSVAWQISSP